MNPQAQHAMLRERRAQHVISAAQRAQHVREPCLLNIYLVAETCVP